MDSYISRYISVGNEIEIHYLEKGKGTPMILIPGLTFSGEIFLNQIEYFSQLYRVIAIDPRGQGLSTKTLHGNNYKVHGQDISKLIEALNLKDIVLVGWSTGNLDLWSYISQFGTKKLKAIITIDMSPKPMSNDPKVWTEGTIDELCEIATELLITPEGTREFFKQYATDIMIQHKMEDNEINYLMDMSAKTPYYICHELFCNAIMCNYYDVVKKISESSFPALMFIAEHWSAIAKTFMEDNFPNIENCVMGGHLMFYEYNEKWNKIVEEFLKRQI